MNRSLLVPEEALKGHENEVLVNFLDCAMTPHFQTHLDVCTMHVVQVEQFKNPIGHQLI